MTTIQVSKKLTLMLIG